MSELQENRRNDARMMSCPNYETCNAPKCPLDELIDLRVFIPGESVCKARKGTRYRLAGTSLKTLGLTRKEYASMLNWYGTREAVIEALDKRYGKGAVA